MWEAAAVEDQNAVQIMRTDHDVQDTVSGVKTRDIGSSLIGDTSSHDRDTATGKPGTDVRVHNPASIDKPGTDVRVHNPTSIDKPGTGLRVHDPTSIDKPGSGVRVHSPVSTDNDTDKPGTGIRVHSPALRDVRNAASDVTVSSIDQAFQRLATALHEGFNLPKPELLRFNGSPLEYCKFICNFEANIEHRVSDNKLKLSYLIQYCDVEARASIEDCVLLKPHEGYKRARDILYSRYGRPYTIARSHIDKLVNGPTLKSSDTNGLSDLALELRKCEITLSQLGFKSDVDSSDNLRRLVKRLPMHVRGKWVDFAYSIIESGKEPCFSDLVEFVEKKTRVATSMYGLDLASESRYGKGAQTSARKHHTVETIPKHKITTLTTNSAKNQSDKQTFVSNSARAGDKSVYVRTCLCCSGKCTDLASCKKFTALSLDAREEFVRSSKLCFNCLKGRHFANTCRKPKGCAVPDCKYKHHFLLHGWVNKTDHTVMQPSVNCTATKGSVKNCLGIIPVIVEGGNGNSCQTYALLDDGADKTLCDERLLQTLDLPSRPVTFQMSTVSSAGSTISGQEVDLQVHQVEGDNEVNLRKVWSVKTLPISMRSAPKKSEFRKLPYLSDIDIPEVDERSVMLLIGTDSPEAHVPLEVRSGDHDQPYAVRTKLGWAVRGPVSTCAAVSTKSANVNFQHSADVSLQKQVEKMWNTDFSEKTDSRKHCMSLEDRRALKTMEGSMQHENGHYTIKLPWRDEEAAMPNNLQLAHARLEQLKRKLSKDPELHQMYTATVTDYIKKGYATEVPIDATDYVYKPCMVLTSSSSY